MKIYKISIYVYMFFFAQANASEAIDGFNFIQHMSQFLFRHETRATLINDVHGDIETNVQEEKVCTNTMPPKLTIEGIIYVKASPLILKAEELYGLAEELSNLDLVSILKRCKDGDRRAIVVSGVVISSIYGFLKLFI